MNFKNFVAATLTAATLIFGSTASAQDNPTCVLMKFTDDTRFVKIESAPSLSDLVMEKLLISGKFNLKETKVIDADMENMLYEERALEFKQAAQAAAGGNYSTLFEGAGFNSEKAQTIATAQVGQFVSPAITSAIGRQHGADYLIQGTIINLGTGNWMDMTAKNVVSYAQTATSLAMNFASTAVGSAAAALGPIGMLASLATMVDMHVTGVAVQADLRLIKAETGEVVWQKMVIGKKTQKQYSVGFIKVGNDKLNNEMYAEAMDNAAEAVANALIEDVDAGKLFVE